jgi:hypothetical protein
MVIRPEAKVAAEKRRNRLLLGFVVAAVVGVVVWYFFIREPSPQERAAAIREANKTIPQRSK